MHPKETLKRFGLSPKKSLAQNFLYDDKILAQITTSAEIKPDDVILEIGPGIGALTRHLSIVSAKVIAVEIDGRLLPILEDQLDPYENVEIVQADILKLPLQGYVADGFKVVANIPYYITGALLRHILSGDCRPSMVVITIQRQVAERLTAKPGQMSLLSTTAQYYGVIELLFGIKAGSFWPRPDVDSAVVRIRTHPKPLLNKDEEESFFRLVKMGYSQKRKQLQKNLRALGYPRSKLYQILSDANIDGRRRAQSLSVEEWLELTRALTRDISPT
jgi:16S rRNA (adenine1518-N6/adenine1519-N6)-dimethyltransferase